MSTFTHFDAQGQAHMVDVADKAPTHRVAIATGTIHMQPATWKLIESGTAKKGVYQNLYFACRVLGWGARLSAIDIKCADELLQVCEVVGDATI